MLQIGFVALLFTECPIFRLVHRISNFGLNRTGYCSQVLLEVLSFKIRPLDQNDLPFCLKKALRAVPNELRQPHMTDFLTKGTDQRKKKQFSIELTKLLTNKEFFFFSFLWEKKRFCRSVSYKTVKISYSNFPCFLLLLVHYDN